MFAPGSGLLTKPWLPRDPVVRCLFFRRTIVGNRLACSACCGFFRTYRSGYRNICIGISVDAPLKIFDAWIHGDEVEAISQNMKIKESEEMKAMEAELYEKQTALEKLIATKTSLYSDMVEGLISREDFREMSETFSQKQCKMKKEIELLTQKLEMEQTAVKLREKREKKLKLLAKQTADKYLKCEELTVEMLQTFVDYVEVKNGEKRGSKELKIHWNF